MGAPQDRTGGSCGPAETDVEAVRDRVLQHLPPAGAGSCILSASVSWGPALQTAPGKRRLRLRGVGVGAWARCPP